MNRAFPEFADTIFVLWHMTFGKHERFVATSQLLLQLDVLHSR
jgi:hypothetical protein